MMNESDFGRGETKRRPARTRKPRKDHKAMSAENKNPDEAGSEPSFETAKAHAKEAAEHLRSAATAKARELREKAGAKASELREKAEEKVHEFRETAEEKVHDFREKAEHTYGEARSRSRTFQDDGEAYIRENPTKAVLTALAAGFVLGLIMRK